MRGDFKKGLAVLTAVIAMMAFPVAASADDAAEAKRLAANITLDGVQLSNYTYPLAYQEFNQRAQKLTRDFLLEVIMNGKRYYLGAGDIGLTANSLELLNQIWFENDGSLGDTFTSSYSYDKSAAQGFADQIVKDLNDSVPPVKNAAPTFNPATKTFSGGPLAGQIIGYDLNQKTFEGQVEKKIADAITADPSHQATLNIKSSPLYSQANPDTAAGYGQLGTFTTYTTNVPNRNTNISLACKALSGTKVAPGRVFSFNNTLGYTSADKGYLEAGILVNGEPDTGLGGGICQVSSTLYNAVLKAGMTVVERHAHSATVGYVPKGQDATVNYGSLDFRFQNNTPNDCYLIFEYNNRTLTVSIYGKR